MEVRTKCSQMLIFAMESHGTECEYLELRPYLLTVLAYTHVQVDRPGMTEALLVSAQAHLMMAECVAALGIQSGGGLLARPIGRIGADMDATPTNDEDRLVKRSEVSLEAACGMASQKDVPVEYGEDLTCLDSYWWGMAQPVWHRVFGEIQHIVADLSKLEQLMRNLGTDELHRRVTMTRQCLNRRAAATINSMAMCEGTDDVVQHLRLMFPGSAFEPTASFVKQLQVGL